MWSTRANIRSLQTIDPNFSELEFLNQAEQIYGAILSAEGASSAPDLSSISTNDLRKCLVKVASELHSHDLAQHISDVRFESANIIKLSITGAQESITVRLHGTWVRYHASEHTGILTQGSTQPRPFTEFAAFVRAAGSTTPKSVAQGGPTHCPSCGAPVQPGTIVCPFCNTPLTGTGGIWQLDSVSLTPYA
jgi:predicted lipid-binding transport protein (Tim44 family)